MNRYLQSASEIFGVAASNLDCFDEKDPFNGNQITGLICKSQGLDYGSLYIVSVNGDEAVQVIRCTPKMHYPFDKNDRWIFPKCTEILAYEKIDGTNVLQYQYVDKVGARYTSYKTRLLPFLRQSKWGDFFSMWQRMMEKYPDLAKLSSLNNCNISYELYGSLNQHLVKYEAALDVAVLFGRKNDRAVIHPARLQTLGVPVAPLITRIDSGYVENYRTQQSAMRDSLKGDAETGFVGSEGQVWYCLTEGSAIQFKCKPEQIEAIHWTQGLHLSKTVVLTTCKNALENTDILTFEFVSQLLQEEFTPEQIDLSKDLINACIDSVNQDATFRQDVLTRYANTGISVLVDKRSVMRAMANHYNKTVMGKVYSIIAAKEGIY